MRDTLTLRKFRFFALKGLAPNLAMEEESLHRYIQRICIFLLDLNTFFFVRAIFAYYSPAMISTNMLTNLKRFIMRDLLVIKSRN